MKSEREICVLEAVSSASRAQLGEIGGVSSQGLTRANLTPNFHSWWQSLNS